MEDFLVDQHWKELISEQGWPSIESWKKRDMFRQSISWHVPTQSLVDLLIELCPIVSVGSGFAYTESLVKSRGGEIIATDLNPDQFNKWCKEGNFYLEVEQIEAAEAVSKYRNRNVFMAWPPYDNPMASNVAHRMSRGNFLIFVGEGYGGCTGNDEFFNFLEKNFELIILEASIPSWHGIHDDIYVYKKK